MPITLGWRDFLRDDRPVYASTWRDRDGFRPHSHDFLEIALVVRGTGVHRSPGRNRAMRAGDGILLRPGTWHAYADGIGFSGWDCCFSPDLLGRELAWMIEDQPLNQLLWTGAAGRRGIVELHLDADAVQQAEALLRSIAVLRRSEAPGTRTELIGLLVQLLALLARNQAAGTGTAERRVHPAVASAIAILDGDLAAPWTVGRLASQVHLEGNYLVRVFRAGTGQPPMAYLQRRRCEIAARLLLRTALPVGEIGARVGWLDANYFARRFRAHFGVSASAFRAQAPAQPG